MKSNCFKLMAFALMMGVSTQVSAQGFLKKLNSKLDNINKKVEKVNETVSKVIPTKDSSTATDEPTVKINYDAVPVYSIKPVVDGTKNEDGTEKITYRLVDQYGNIRTPEAIKKQQKALDKAVLTILAKIGGGAAIGAIADGGKGALIGGAVGAVASIGDIKKAKDLKSSLSNQEKLVNAYTQNFTEEGLPVSAEVNMEEIEGLDATPMEVDPTKLEELLAKADDASTDAFLSE